MTVAQPSSRSRPVNEPTGTKRATNPSTTPRLTAKQQTTNKENTPLCEDKVKPSSAPVKKQKMHRSKLWHASVFCFFWGNLLLSVYFQQQIKDFCRPVFDMVENTWFAHCFLCAFVAAIPEPSPVVVVWAAWVAFGSFQSWYQWIFSLWGVWRMFHVLLPIIVLTIYFGNGFLIMALDLYLAPEWMNKYRLQPKKRFDTKKLPGLLKTVILNFLIAGPVVSVLHKFMGLRYDEELPGPLETCLHFIPYIAANEIYFFYIHMLMHTNKTMYGMFHKVHHEWKTPVALASLYAHPVEVCCVILGQFTIGPILFGGHFYTILIWTCSVVMVSQTHHCGFHWPWIPASGDQPDFHDLHHEKFNLNYGSFTGKFSLDGLHGTLEEDPWAN
eukprot:TRINITY_DN1828_c0_g1_i3.p1 TRINITY_DN1828_c0_g1~~TRINITY_DN1828_c0_g1_i3.p1  ORF type:complete len:415 (+),score=74.87 TRINITY_DN1828_c0_g1_i3:92-1246(+)